MYFLLRSFLTCNVLSKSIFVLLPTRVGSSHCPDLCVRQNVFPFFHYALRPSSRPILFLSFTPFYMQENYLQSSACKFLNMLHLFVYLGFLYILFFSCRSQICYLEKKIQPHIMSWFCITCCYVISYIPSRWYLTWMTIFLGEEVVDVVSSVVLEKLNFSFNVEGVLHIPDVFFMFFFFFWDSDLSIYCRCFIWLFYSFSVPKIFCWYFIFVCVAKTCLLAQMSGVFIPCTFSDIKL